MYRETMLIPKEKLWKFSNLSTNNWNYKDKIFLFQKQLSDPSTVWPSKDSRQQLKIYKNVFQVASNSIFCLNLPNVGITVYTI